MSFPLLTANVMTEPESESDLLKADEDSSSVNSPDVCHGIVEAISEAK